MNSANISCIIFQESFCAIKKSSDYQQIIQKSFFSHNFHFVQSVYQIKQLICESPVPDSRLQHCRREYLSSQHSPLLSHNDYTTLGRGGSDTTAEALAAALHADACEIYTDVDGVYTADPRLVPTARKLNAITYDEMLDLATLGAGVLHNRSVEMAKKYGVPLVVRSSLNESEGTVVKEVVKKMERMLISGVALDKDADRISVIGIKDAPGSAFKLFNTLAKKNINVDIIIQSVGREGTKDISFTVAHDNLKEAIELLEEYQEVLGFERVDYNCEVAKLSIVGAGMMSNPGVAAKMFECLYNENVNINMIATSEIRITVLVNSEDAVRAMNAVHDAFGLAEA